MPRRHNAPTTKSLRTCIALILPLRTQASISAAGMSDSPSSVFVTGAAGLVGSAVALEFLRQGLRVKLAFRKQAQIDEWNAKHSAFKAQTTFALIPDFLAPGAFDAALKGIDYIAHVAAPINFAPTVSSGGLRALGKHRWFAQSTCFLYRTYSKMLSTRRLITISRCCAVHTTRSQSKRLF